MDVFVLYFVGPDTQGHTFGKFLGGLLFPGPCGEGDQAHPKLA